MSVLAALSQAAYLADDTDVGDETHKAGPVAILVIVVLCVACFLLFRSMSKHMRRVRDRFPDDVPSLDTVPPEPDDPATLPGDAPRSTAAGAPPATPGGAATPSVHRATPKSRPRDDSTAR